MENEQIPQFSVSDFLAVVNQSLEMAFGSVYIEGEVASFKVNHQKYVFFDLKDASGSVGCFMTVWQLRVPLEDGMRVLVRAVPKVTPWGKFSLTVQEVKPVGEGSIKKSSELLRQKLTKEGLFELDRKRSLPTMPGRVAVISSTGAAGYADFMKIANDRFGGVEFMVGNVQVQGAGAADQIIKALQYFNQMAEVPEVIVIVRGGGSADDLAVFNDEPLVRAIAGSRVPVLTGIGHETDESLSDLAADVRAVTPSNAAQSLLPDKQAVIERIRRSQKELLDQMSRAIDETLLLPRRSREESLSQWLLAVEGLLSVVSSQRQAIKEYNPEVILKRGYALVEGDLRKGGVVNITTKDALMKARIEKYVKR